MRTRVLYGMTALLVAKSPSYCAGSLFLTFRQVRQDADSLAQVSTPRSSLLLALAPSCPRLISLASQTIFPTFLVRYQSLPNVVLAGLVTGR